MKLKVLLFSAIVALGLNANAQTWVSDSVAMGSGYAKDMYYSLKNGQIDTGVVNNNWHLAFEMIPGGPGFGGVSILGNHVGGNVKVYSLHKPGSYFGLLTPPDTNTKTQLYNTDTNWHWGAFNTLTSGMYNYGWGTYSTSTHHVEGDSLYLLNINGTAYKMFVSHYHSTPASNIYYAFRIAKFDGTNDYMDTIRRSSGYANKNFAYFNVLTNSELNREPDQNNWDIVFTRAIEYVSAGPGPLQPYPVTTVLSNIGVSVCEVNDLNPPTTGYASKTYSNDIHVIGSDWKKQPPPVWTVRDSAHYFIKTTKTNEYYQLHFTRFDGSSTGKAVFEKRKLGDIPVSIKETKGSLYAFAVVPNPAVNNATIMIDAQENGNAMIIISDITGKIVEKSDISLNNGVNGYNINTSNYVAGTYIVTLTNGDWKINRKLVVQH